MISQPVDSPVARSIVDWRRRGSIVASRYGRRAQRLRWIAAQEMLIRWRRLKAAAVDYGEEFVLKDAGRFARMARRLDEDRLLREGHRRAMLAARRAWSHVPAYREFLGAHGLRSIRVPFERLPKMGKDNYVAAYPTADRCVGGAYLGPGVAIDESSGSTGRPFDWVRGDAERRRSQRELVRMIEWVYDRRPHLTINAFSMGAWATGVHLAEAMQLHGAVKSTGPDVDKLMHTLEFFGPDVEYFICGYPPFLKLLLDTMRRRDFPVERYTLHALVGGEGMTEAFRRYLLLAFDSCYSGYGASDLDMGIASETPETIAVRDVLNDRPEVRHELLDGERRIPMVFQYNPLKYHLETDRDGALVVTLNYSKLLSPRVRYAIGDEARLLRRSDLLATLRSLGHPIELPADRTLDLPYLLLFGRCDHTISIMGANIYPDDVQQILLAEPRLASGFASFRIEIGDRGAGEVFPRLCVEWTTPEPPVLPVREIASSLQRRLAALNADYRQSLCEFPRAMQVELEVHGYGAGPFAGRGERIKDSYISRGASR